MNPFLEKLKALPPDTPLTACHVAAIVQTMLASKNTDYDSLPLSKLIDEEALAEWLGESTSTLQKWRVKGGGPNFVRTPKSVRYSVGAVRDWIASRTVSSTSEATVKGLSKLESTNIVPQLSMPWTDPYPVMIADGKFIGFFRSLREDLEIEPDSFRVVRVRALSALHPPKLPNDLQAEAASLIAAIGDFADMVIKNPQKARDIYGEWEDRVNDCERLGFFSNALAFDLDFAKHIGKMFSPSFVADHFNPATWLWFLLVEHGEGDLYFENLQWVFSYLSNMEVGINKSTIIEDRAGCEVFSGTVAHLLADTTAEFFHIHSREQPMQYYAHLISTLLTLGLSADLPNNGQTGITAGQIAGIVDSKYGPGASPFITVISRYELEEKLHSELTKSESKSNGISRNKTENVGKV
jgi:predicted DNA-binding transcriptional regulator AlpA